MADQFLNQVNLARRWHVSPRTLERWRWTGDGPAYFKIGGRVVYRLDDVEDYERRRRCESMAQATALRVVQ